MTARMVARMQDGPVIGIGMLEACPHPTGALHLPSERTLLMADLHLEKASSFARRGVFLPPYDTRATLNAMAQAIAIFNPRRVICLGDSFHDAEGAGRLDREDQAELGRLQAGRDWLWLTGNHDPAAGPGLAGEVAAEHELSGTVLRHLPSAELASDAAEIAGHLHPAAKVSLRGRSVRRRCFIGDGRRLLMPAMGALAGGLNIRDLAISRLFGSRADVWMLGDGRVFGINRTLLLPD